MISSIRPSLRLARAVLPGQAGLARGRLCQPTRIGHVSGVRRRVSTLASRRSGTAMPMPSVASSSAVRTLPGLSALSALGRRYPFAFQLVICTAKTAACDLLVQKYVEGKDKIDWRRNAVFVAFGSVYLGGFQYVLYSKWFPRLFPYAKYWSELPLRVKVKDVKGIVTMFQQIAVDLLVHNPFVYMPTFYVFKALVKTEEGVTTSPLNIASSALTSYKQNFIKDNLAMGAVAGVGDIFAFGAPMWLRLPLNHVASFVWVCVLSAMRGGDTKPQPEAAVAQHAATLDHRAAMASLQVQGQRLLAASARADESSPLSSSH